MIELQSNCLRCGKIWSRNTRKRFEKPQSYRYKQDNFHCKCGIQYYFEIGVGMTATLTNFPHPDKFIVWREGYGEGDSSTKIHPPAPKLGCFLYEFKYGSYPRPTGYIPKELPLLPMDTIQEDVERYLILL